MGFIALILIALIVYGYVELYRKNNDLDSWFDGLFDIIDTVLK